MKPAELSLEALTAAAKTIHKGNDRVKLSIFESAALRRAVEAYDAYLTQQLKTPEDRRDTFAAAATRFRRTLQAELDSLALGEPSDDT